MCVALVMPIALCARFWLAFKARWNGTSNQARTEAETNKKLTQIVVYCSRICTLIVFSQASLLTACNSYLLSINRHNDEHCNQRKKKTKDQFKRHQLAIESCYLEQLARSTIINRLFECYLILINCIYIWWLILLLVTALLDFKALAQYRYLDCYLLGRFSMNARISQATKYVCIVVVPFFLAFRLAIVSYKPQFHLQMLNFMHMNLHIVEQHHHQSSSSNLAAIESTPSLARKSDNCAIIERNDLHCNLNVWSEHHDQIDQHAHCDHDEILSTKAHFEPLSRNNLSLRKLNRRPEHWFRLNVVLIVVFIAGAICSTSWLIWVLSIMTPTIVTKRGFEFSYPNCVSFIREQVNGSGVRALEWDFIYNGTSAPLAAYNKRQDVPVSVPMEDFVSGLYHTIRIVCDYGQSLTLYLDAPGLLLAHIIVHVLLCYDLSMNCVELHKRLVFLRNIKWNHSCEQARQSRRPPIEIGEQNCDTLHTKRPVFLSVQLDHHQSYRSTSMSFIGQPKFATPQWAGPNRSLVMHSNLRPTTAATITNETIVLQALLLNHFKVTSQYNRYVSSICLYVSCLWLAITCCVLTWLGITGSGAVEHEFYVIQVSASVAILSYLVMLSRVRTSNHAFYPLIASLMALDDDQSLTKMRWARIMEHFHPQPMYCFTLISAEISHMLVFRLIAWVFSALFVIVSFFYERLARMKLRG